MNNIKIYIDKLKNILTYKSLKNTELLAKQLLILCKKKKKLFICGNGGSAANANHIANDLLCGVKTKYFSGINVESLASNTSVITCIANDKNYEDIFSEQLAAKGSKNDLLLVLSGSGNSRNILKAIITAHSLKMNTFAILGYDGGKAKKIVKNSIHVSINDMQISEDSQLIISHICMQWLKNELSKNS
jgi:D-sedoheptulose 7-phosphate isomerase